MKIKVDQLQHTHTLGPFISTIPPDIHRSRYCLLRSQSKEIIVEPFLSLDDSAVLRIGKTLLDILNTKDTYCDLIPYSETLPVAKNLYVFTNYQVPVSLFLNLKHVGVNYDTSDFEILSIDDNSHKYYTINETTSIYQTNVMPRKLYGYKKTEDLVEKELFASLFKRDEFEKYRLPCSNVYVMKGGPSTRKEDLCTKAAKNLKANNVHICMKECDFEYINSIIKDGLENTLFVFKSSFEKDISTLCKLCEFISTNINGAFDKFAFMFLLEEDEHVEKLVNYFNHKLEVFTVTMPIMDKACKIFCKMLNAIPNRITKKESIKIGRMLVGLPIVETEEIFKAVLSDAIYENKHDRHGKGYSLTYKNFMDVLMKNEKVVEMNRGVLYKAWKFLSKRRSN